MRNTRVLTRALGRSRDRELGARWCAALPAVRRCLSCRGCTVEIRNNEDREGWKTECNRRRSDELTRVQNRLTDRTVRLIVVDRKLAGLRDISRVEYRGGGPRRGVEVNLRDEGLECEGEQCEQRNRQPPKVWALRFRFRFCPLRTEHAAAHPDAAGNVGAGPRRGNSTPRQVNTSAASGCRRNHAMA